MVIVSPITKPCANSKLYNMNDLECAKDTKNVIMSRRPERNESNFYVN